MTFCTARSHRRCSVSHLQLKPEMTICTRSVALTKLKRGRRGLNAFKHPGPLKGEARIDRSSQSVSEARPAKVDLILADTSGKMDTWRNPVISPNHQSEPPGRRRVGEKPTRLRENAWKFRGSSFPCQGNKHRLTENV